MAPAFDKEIQNDIKPRNSYCPLMELLEVNWCTLSFPDPENVQIPRPPLLTSEFTACICTQEKEGLNSTMENKLLTTLDKGNNDS